MAALKLDCSVLTIVACIIIGSSCIDANTWCMINNNATPNVLQNNLDYACSHGADCSAIQPGASCFKPDNVFRHAAYAYDSYYVNHGKTPESCNFAGTGHVIHNDPSSFVCKFPSSLKRNDEKTNTTITESPMKNSKLQSSQGVRKLGPRDTRTN
ncbi:hypothetical protein Lal_00049724 [Lupinus albus]|nr:hypothetical protein Lal_00049724 [Lupinus albus]